MIIHYNVKVSGKVQGVFYRASVKEKADELRISGFVRNQPDGSVYLEAEGTQDQLGELIAWCRQGPPHARVTDVVVNSSDVKNFYEFEIRR